MIHPDRLSALIRAYLSYILTYLDAVAQLTDLEYNGWARRSKTFLEMAKGQFTKIGPFDRRSKAAGTMHPVQLGGSIGCT